MEHQNVLLKGCIQLLQSKYVLHLQVNVHQGEVFLNDGIVFT